MFGFMIWLAIGGTLGWLASVLTRVDRQQAILSNVIAGIVGAYAGGALLAPALRADSVVGYVAAIMGASLLIGTVNLAKRRWPS